jgi:demethylsterigmatocystin 6-O-methyltransferase
MDALIAQIASYDLSTISEDERIRLQNALHEAALRTETMYDTMNRFWLKAVELPMIMSGFDLSVFKLLAASPDKAPLSADDIARAKGLEPANAPLIHRVLRFLAAYGALDEVAKDTYVANNVTRNLADERIEAGISWV